MNFEIITGYRKNSQLLYVLDQRMIYVKKSVYNSINKYECRVKTCKARVSVHPDGKCVLAKNYVEHNHENEEEVYKELKALNSIKDECEDLAGTLGGDTSAMSSIRSSFRKICET